MERGNGGIWLMYLTDLWENRAEKPVEIIK
jgi:hypothetical protein